MADERGEEDRDIQLVEERVVTSRRVVETGRVKVQTVVEERETLVREQLGRTHVEVERVPVHIEVEEVPPVREEGEVMVIPVVQEVVVVLKKLVVTEEVRIRRRRSTEEFAQPVTLRAQRVVVEREEAVDNG